MADTNNEENSTEETAEEEVVSEDAEEEVEGLIQHESFKELNNLNSLNPRSFRAFLNVVEDGSWSNKDDVAFSCASHSIPSPTIADIVNFFVKEGGSMLHVFCGSGRVAANICAHADIECMGITLLERDLERYQDRIKNDMFAVESKILIGDAREVLERGEGLETYEFILVDPPRFGLIDSPNLKEKVHPQDVRFQTKTGFFDYMAEVLSLSALYLKDGGYIAAIIDDQFHKGQYVCSGAMVTDRVCGLHLRGMKIFRFARRGEVKGNFARYLPIINSTPVYIYQIS